MAWPEWLKLCNCANCGQELTGPSCARQVADNFLEGIVPPYVRGRILGRPYCSDCLDIHKLKPMAEAVPEDPEEDLDVYLRELFG